MKIAEVITPRMMNAMQKPMLRATPEHYRQARGNKAQVIALMEPMDFLLLAAPPNEIHQFKQNAQALRMYNQYAKAGENIHMPFLRVAVFDKAHGRVLSHEGRHRAAAVLNAGGKWLRVAFILDARKDYEPEMSRAELAKYGHYRNNIEYCMTAADLPDRIQNQYNSLLGLSTQFWKIEVADNLGRYRR